MTKLSLIKPPPAIPVMDVSELIPIQEELDELDKVNFEQIVEAATLLSPERQYTLITCP